MSREATDAEFMSACQPFSPDVEIHSQILYQNPIPRVLDVPHGTTPTWLDPVDGEDHLHVWLAVRNEHGKIVAALCRDCSSTLWQQPQYVDGEYPGRTPEQGDAYRAEVRRRQSEPKVQQALADSVSGIQPIDHDDRFTVLSWAHKGDDEPTVFSIRRNEDGTTFHCKVEKVWSTRAIPSRWGKAESTIEPKETT